MSEQGATVEHYMMVALVFTVISLLTLPIAIGYLYGAGAGWLSFALICFGLAVWTIKVAKDKAKADSAKEQASE